MNPTHPYGAFDSSRDDQLAALAARQPRAVTGDLKTLLTRDS
jgi:hypothetical protein